MNEASKSEQGEPYVHIYAPPVLHNRVVICDKCPDCKKRTRMICFFQEWYGWTSTCLRCGRGFEDGEWLELPFVRGSRAKQIAAAKDRWRRTTTRAEAGAGEKEEG